LNLADTFLIQDWLKIGEALADFCYRFLPVPTPNPPPMTPAKLRVNEQSHCDCPEQAQA